MDDRVYEPIDNNSETSYQQPVWPLADGTAMDGAVHVAQATDAAIGEALIGAAETHFLAHWEGEVNGVWSCSPVFQWDTAAAPCHELGATRLRKAPLGSTLHWPRTRE
ncbi:MAG: hypothetical protein M3387_01625 [Actinomycetota bacterium]|nr:hypothetical protein [Actinomycetota bacterium]